MSDRRTHWSTEALLLGSGMFAPLAMSALSPVLPKIQQAFGGTTDAAFMTKATVMVVGIAMIIASPLSGALVRKLGARRLLAGCYTLFLVAGVAGMMLPTLPGIVATRLFVGAAAAVIVALAISLIGTLYEGRARERRIGAIHGLGAALLAMLVPTSGLLGDLGGWRMAFLVHLVALPFLILTLISPDLATIQKDPQHGARASSSIRPVLGIALVAILAGSITFSIPVFEPFRLVEIGVRSSAVAGAMFSITVGFSVASSLAFGELRRFAPNAILFLLAFGFWACGLTVVGFATTIQGVASGMVLIGLGGGLVGPTIFSLVASLSSDADRARNTGLVKGVYYAGPFLGPSALHLAFPHEPASTSLFALASLAGLLAVAACMMATRSRTIEPST
ncbi:MFS transporter [Sphingomonas colocasiae]|uniref:MFS transporter n=1 Tax=Sphingomonas colocasiae TaxID=1848973 RepID=A0ABS7PI97_9SPHN|nr:MFS transporter [Sphingomonas colocasiae]MBY8821020.1 MFS transporter [Sphingomonas colocasiae]